MRRGFPPASRPFRFRCALGFLSLGLARMLDSLVRVSRRVVRDLLTGVDGRRHARLAVTGGEPRRSRGRDPPPP